MRDSILRRNGGLFHFFKATRVKIRNWTYRSDRRGPVPSSRNGARRRELLHLRYRLSVVISIAGTVEDAVPLHQAWTIAFTLSAIGFGLGLLVGAGKNPRRLSVIGAVITLVAAALYGLENYLFFFGPAMKTVSGAG